MDSGYKCHQFGGGRIFHHRGAEFAQSSQRKKREREREREKKNNSVIFSFLCELCAPSVPLW